MAHTGEYVDYDKYKYVGYIDDVNKAFFDDMKRRNITPIIASVSKKNDSYLNVNADLVAVKLACKLDPEFVLFINDTGKYLGLGLGIKP